MKRPGSETDCSEIEPAFVPRAINVQDWYWLLSLFVPRVSDFSRIYVCYSWGKVGLNPLDTPATAEPIVPAPDIRDDEKQWVE